MNRSDNSPRKAVVIDDDSGFVTVLCRRLEQSGWRHIVVSALPPTAELVAMRPDAVVVNPGLFGAGQWDALQSLGESLGAVGLIVCSEQSTVAQRVRGLRMGVDDWIGKPCHPEEVVARLEAVTRRRRRFEADSIADAGPLTHGELEFRIDRYEVMAAGLPVELTRREYELLLLLARSDGRVLPREDIYQRVWGYAMARGDRSVDVFIRKIRRKLDAASPDWRYVHTHFGIGYRFDPELSGAHATAVSTGDAAGSDLPGAGVVTDDDSAPLVER
jgi:DNA-binding response OmpR family regulator